MNTESPETMLAVVSAVLVEAVEQDGDDNDADHAEHTEHGSQDNLQRLLIFLVTRLRHLHVLCGTHKYRQVRINVSTGCLKWCPMLQQMRESMLRLTFHLLVAIKTQLIQSSDWLNWHCALWHYVILWFLSDQMSFQVLRQTGCQ